MALGTIDSVKYIENGLKLGNIEIIETSYGWQVKGYTYSVKEYLKKEFNAHWNKDAKAWDIAIMDCYSDGRDSYHYALLNDACKPDQEEQEQEEQEQEEQEQEEQEEQEQKEQEQEEQEQEEREQEEQEEQEQKKMSKMAFKKDENGSMTETTASLKRRIADTFGFQLSKIVPLEADFDHYDAYNGITYYYYCCVDFQVNGKGYSCSFFDESLHTSPSFDAVSYN